MSIITVSNRSGWKVFPVSGYWGCSISSELAALVVNEVYKAFDYEKSKSVIEELLKSSEESTTDDSQIQMEGNEYDEGNIYCAYQPDLNIVIIFPPDLDIYDIMTWSNIQ